MLNESRKGIRSEREYTESAAGVLRAQHSRLVQILEAYLQTASWMRIADLTDRERQVVSLAEKLVAESKAEVA